MEVVGMAERGHKEKIEIRMSFRGELARRLDAIKRYYQFRTYTEVIRFLISSKYEEIRAGRE